MEHLKIRKFWGYRGAMANHTVGYTLPRSLTQNLEHSLFAAAGQQKDNKCTFMVEDNNGKEFFITFYDLITIISSAAEVFNYEINGSGEEFSPPIKVK